MSHGIRVWMWHGTYIVMAHIYEWVMAHMWMRHSTHRNETEVAMSMTVTESWHTYMNESWHTYMNESWHVCECVMSHVAMRWRWQCRWLWLSHGTHIWMSHGTLQIHSIPTSPLSSSGSRNTKVVPVVCNAPPPIQRKKRTRHGSNKCCVKI